MKYDFGLLGGGSFGTAMALHLARRGHHVALWTRSESHYQQMIATGINQRYLPEHPLPSDMALFQQIQDVCQQSQSIIISVPSHAFCEVLEQLPSNLTELCWLTKGIDPDSKQLFHTIVKKRYPNISFGILSGPSFANEVAKGLPTALTLAGNNRSYTERLVTAFHGNNMRVYRTDDYVGVQIAGAMKNVLAIAVGISDGLGFGANARAALITRGLTEMQRLGIAFGAQAKTFTGLTALGDLVLTATDNQSRNRRFGLQLGQGASLQQALKSINQVVEGKDNALQVCQLGQDKQITLPICETIHHIIHKNLSAQQAVESLLNRPATYE